MSQHVGFYGRLRVGDLVWAYYWNSSFGKEKALAKIINIFPPHIYVEFIGRDHTHGYRDLEDCRKLTPLEELALITNEQK